MGNTRIACLLVGLLALTIVIFAATGQSGTLTSSCQYCAVGETITFQGTGYQHNPHNALLLIVWDADEPVTCSDPDKSGDFTCSITINEVGVYNAVAYSNSKSVIGATNLIVQ